MAFLSRLNSINHVIPLRFLRELRVEVSVMRQGLLEEVMEEVAALVERPDKCVVAVVEKEG